MQQKGRTLKNYLLDHKDRDAMYGAVDYLDDDGVESPINRRKIEMPEMSRMKPSSSIDEFGEPQIYNVAKAYKTGRQRKRSAARTKGGEFQAKRKKRRLYFCCIASEVDVEKLADKFAQPFMGLKGKMYDEVLHLFMDKIEDLSIPTKELAANLKLHSRAPRSSFDVMEPVYEVNDLNDLNMGGRSQSDLIGLEILNEFPDHEDVDPKSTAAFWNYGGKEVFVFDFGAIVFWGYHRSEVTDLLVLIRSFTNETSLTKVEFEAGEDDVAFVTASEVDTITIANDVITLPDFASTKSRLAVSFAIAQSAVLSIFEARVENRIEEYKYIPEVLAASGKVKLRHKELGNMIGDVFVIQHDVNLHSEILNIPDYFWKEHTVEPLYSMTMKYLEMETRTEVLNKRLDLLRELLRVLQQQHENAHNVTLEWVIIWLIVVSVVLEVWSIYVDILAIT